MTGKKPRPSGEEPEMTFEAPDTVPLEAVEDDDPKRQPRDLGTVAVGTAGFAASSAINPDSTSAATDNAGQDVSPFDDSLDIFDTIEPEDGPDALPDLPSPDTAALSSIYGAQSTAGGGFNLTDADPELDFSPIDFTITTPVTTELESTADTIAGATSLAGGGQPTLEAPEPPQFHDEPLHADTADLDIIEDDDDDAGDDVGG